MTPPPIMRTATRPTGGLEYRIDGRVVSESAFFAAAASHPTPVMRDWAQAWRESREGQA